MDKTIAITNSTNILSEDFINSYADKQPNWGFDGLGYITYKRTYSRKMEDDSREEWHQTLGRCINGAQKIGAGYTIEEAKELFDFLFYLKCSLAGRMLWQLGTSTVDRFGGNSLLNCFEFNTEIITQEGVKRIGNLVNTSQMLLSEDQKWIKSEIKSFGEQPLWELKITKDGKAKSIFTTRNHNWYRKSYIEGHGTIKLFTCNLRPGDVLVSSYENKVDELTGSDWIVLSATKTDRVEPVYCAVVPGTHTFTLNGNY